MHSHSQQTIISALGIQNIPISISTSTNMATPTHRHLCMHLIKESTGLKIKNAYSTVFCSHSQDCFPLEIEEPEIENLSLWQKKNSLFHKVLYREFQNSMSIESSLLSLLRCVAMKKEVLVFENTPMQLWCHHHELWLQAIRGEKSFGCHFGSL